MRIQHFVAIFILRLQNELTWQYLEFSIDVDVKLVYTDNADTIIYFKSELGR